MTTLLITLLIIIISYSLSVVSEGGTSGFGALFLSGTAKIVAFCGVCYLLCIILFSGGDVVRNAYYKSKSNSRKEVQELFLSITNPSKEMKLDSERAVDKARRMEEKVTKTIFELTDSEMFSLEELLEQEKPFDVR